MSRAWVLNLDVEREFEAGPSYRISQRASAAVERAIPHIQGGLVQPGDVRLVDDAGAQNLWGHAWCPSQQARERLQRAGARLAASPSHAVLARVNRRDFLLPVERELGLDFGKRLVSEPEMLREQLELNSQQVFLVRRPYGAAGRGSRRFGGRGESLEAEDPELRWLRAGFAQGPLVLEPFVSLELELSWHAWLPRGGAPIHIGRPCVQDVNPSGTWQSSRLAASGELTLAEAEALVCALKACAQALRAAGYFGPFGIDGFRYRDAQGHAGRLQPLGELNARFSMGWALGMGPRELELALRDLEDDKHK